MVLWLGVFMVFFSVGVGVGFGCFCGGVFVVLVC